LNIKELRIDNLRNLVSVQLRAHPALNVLVGDNGAGKTSILEAIMVLSRGRSFRTTVTSELIGPAGASLKVFAETAGDDGRIGRLGLERAGKHWKARKNAVELSQISQLTRSLPLVLMEPNSHLLVSGTPEHRRKFLDWGVFHVEHGFLQIWRRYSRALKQRNAALRGKNEEVIDSLDPILCPLGEQLNELRMAHAVNVNQEVEGLLPRLSKTMGKIAIQYRNGWGEGDFSQALSENRSRDLERGQTHQGPHRAELVLMAGENLARTVLSRGEQKTLSAALLLAQAGLLSRLGEKPLVLLDDLASEFDENHFNCVLSMALEIGGQTWLTGTRLPELSNEHSVFHVERGEVREVV
jgi:DNA replication and repair protein RecF